MKEFYELDVVEKHYKENYSRYVKQLVNRVVNKCPAFAEEVVQEAYTRAIQYYPSFDDKIKPFDKWFRTILNNALRDHKKEEKNYTLVDELEDTAEYSPILMNKEFINRIEMEIERYGDQKKEVLTLWFKYQYKPRDIGKIVNMSPTNIRKTISNFRKDIYDIMKGR